MELVRPSADDGEVEELFEVLPGGGSFNAGNKATHAEFVVTALQHLERAGARVVAGSHQVGPIQVGARVLGADGRMWLVLLHGTVDDTKRAGMRRTDTLKKAGFDVQLLRDLSPLPILVVTSHLAAEGAAKELAEVLRGWADDLVAVEGDVRGFHRLCGHFGGRVPTDPPPTRALGEDLVGEQLGLFDA